MPVPHLRPLHRCGLAAALALGVPQAAHSQVLPPPPPAPWPFTTAERARNVAVNAVLGAGVAGVRALVQRQPLRRALLLGAAGGGVTGAAKQVIGGSRQASGVAGRVLGAAGQSLIVSATTPGGYAALPLGPLLLEWQRGPLPGDSTPGDTTAARNGRWRMNWRVNVWSTAVTALALARGDRLDATASLWALTPVVRRPATEMPFGYEADGYSFGGLLILADDLSPDSPRRLVLAHEAIHAVQWDQLGLPAALPIERAALARTRLPRALVRHVDLGLVQAGAAYWATTLMPYEDQPWEREAYRLTSDPYIHRQPPRR